MAKRKMQSDIARQIAAAEEMARAVQKAVRKAVLDHKRAGNPIATWQDEQVVWIQPEQIDLPEEEPNR